MTPLRADLLAAKLEAWKNGEIPAFQNQIAEDPRLVELLWFIQAASWRPGGIGTLVGRLLEIYPERIGSEGMLKAGIPTDAGGTWKLDGCLDVWKEMNRMAHRNGEHFYDEFVEWSDAAISSQSTTETISLYEGESKKQIEMGLQRFNFEYFRSHCMLKAKSHLDKYLNSLCEHVGTEIKSPWYFPRLLETLFDYLEVYANEARRGMAETEVSRLVFKRLRFGQSTRSAVMILGDSRVGKTKTVSTWCNMNPGRARLVTVPDSGREWNFYAAHADALGLPYNDKTSQHVLKRAVEYTLRHSGLFLVYDESHFLLPTRYSKNTAPQRLNWVRCQVIDRGMGVAFFATRQTYQMTMKKFVATTQHQIEQWIGRITPPLALPAELNPEEMMEAAKASCPPMDEELLALIVERCISTETGFRHLVTVATYACFLAQERGCRAPEQQDVDEAIAEMLRSSEAKPEPVPALRQPPAKPSRPCRDREVEAPPAANRISSLKQNSSADLVGVELG